MLDDEILSYKVTCTLKDSGCVLEYGFSTEESAKDFIIANRVNWGGYRLIKLSVAIIDF